MFSKASARQNLCCKYREFWRELSSTHSVEHPSGMFTPRIIFVMLEFFFYYYTLQKALRAFQSCFDFIGQALILQIMHWFYRSCTDFIGHALIFRGHALILQVRRSSSTLLPRTRNICFLTPTPVQCSDRSTGRPSWTESTYPT